MIYGDVNNNGTVDAADAKLAKSLIDTVPTEEELTAADVDDDGKITENDVNLILQAVGNEFYAQLFPCAKAMYSAPDYLSGRTMYCDGDSVAYGSGTNIMGNSTYSFCNYVAEKYNMTMTNKATPGTTLAIRKDFIGTDHRSILERVREMKGSYDVILLDGGFNDLFKNVEMGAMTDIKINRENTMNTPQQVRWKVFAIFSIRIIKTRLSCSYSVTIAQQEKTVTVLVFNEKYT